MTPKELWDDPNNVLDEDYDLATAHKAEVTAAELRTQSLHTLKSDLASSRLMSQAAVQLEQQSILIARLWSVVHCLTGTIPEEAPN